MKNRFIKTRVEENIFHILWKKRSEKIVDKKFIKLLSAFLKEIDKNKVELIFIDATNLGILFDDKLIEIAHELVFPILSKKIKKIALYIDPDAGEYEFKKIGIDQFYEKIMVTINIEAKIFFDKNECLNWLTKN